MRALFFRKWLWMTVSLVTAAVLVATLPASLSSLNIGMVLSVALLFGWFASNVPIVGRFLTFAALVFVGLETFGSQFVPLSIIAVWHSSLISNITGAYVMAFALLVQTVQWWMVYDDEAPTISVARAVVFLMVPLVTFFAAFVLYAYGFSTWQWLGIGIGGVIFQLAYGLNMSSSSSVQSEEPSDAQRPPTTAAQATSPASMVASKSEGPSDTNRSVSLNSQPAPVPAS